MTIKGPQARLYELYVMSEQPQPKKGLTESIKELWTVENNYSERYLHSNNFTELYCYLMHFISNNY